MKIMASQLSLKAYSGIEVLQVSKSETIRYNAVTVSPFPETVTIQLHFQHRNGAPE